MKAKNSDISTNMEGYLEEIFDQFQEFVSTELHIIKRIDDDLMKTYSIRAILVFSIE